MADKEAGSRKLSRTPSRGLLNSKSGLLKPGWSKQSLDANTPGSPISKAASKKTLGRRDAKTVELEKEEEKKGPVFAPGDYVELFDLATVVYNGQCGTVQGPAETNRYDVELDSGEEVRVKALNLMAKARPATTDSSASPAAAAPPRPSPSPPPPSSSPSPPPSSPSPPSSVATPPPPPSSSSSPSSSTSTVSSNSATTTPTSASSESCPPSSVSPDGEVKEAEGEIHRLSITKEGTTETGSSDTTAPTTREGSGSIADDAPIEPKVAEQRVRVVRELISTEETYVMSLELLHKDYYKPMKAASMLYGVTPAQVASMFSCFEALMSFHQSFLRELKELMAGDDGPGKVLAPIWALFLKQADYLKMYSTYMTNYPKAAGVISGLRDTPKFQGLLIRNREKRGLDFMSYLIMPVQRIPRYELLLKEVLRHTPPRHPEHAPLSLCLSKVQLIGAQMNEGQRQAEQMTKVLEIQNRMQGGISLLSPGRSLIRDGPLLKASVGFLGKDTSHTRLFFLFNDKLVWCTPKYEYRGHVELLGAVVTEIEGSSSKSKPTGTLKISQALIDEEERAAAARAAAEEKGEPRSPKAEEKGPPTLTRPSTLTGAPPLGRQLSGKKGSLSLPSGASAAASPRNLGPPATPPVKSTKSRTSFNSSNGELVVPTLRIEGLIATKADQDEKPEKYIMVTAASISEHEAWKTDLDNAIEAHANLFKVAKERRATSGTTAGTQLPTPTFASGLSSSRLHAVALGNQPVLEGDEDAGVASPSAPASTLMVSTASSSAKHRSRSTGPKGSATLKFSKNKERGTSTDSSAAGRRNSK